MDGGDGVEGGGEEDGEEEGPDGGPGRGGRGGGDGGGSDVAGSPALREMFSLRDALGFVAASLDEPGGEDREIRWTAAHRLLSPILSRLQEVGPAVAGTYGLDPDSFRAATVSLIAAESLLVRGVVVPAPAAPADEATAPTAGRALGASSSGPGVPGSSSGSSAPSGPGGRSGLDGLGGATGGVGVGGAPAPRRALAVGPWGPGPDSVDPLTAPLRFLRQAVSQLDEALDDVPLVERQLAQAMRGFAQVA